MRKIQPEKERGCLRLGKTVTNNTQQHWKQRKVFFKTRNTSHSMFPLKPQLNHRNIPTQHMAKLLGPTCLATLSWHVLLGVVGSNVTFFKLEPTTPNMPWHIATRWPNAHNMLGVFMLRSFGQGLTLVKIPLLCVAGPVLQSHQDCCTSFQQPNSETKFKKTSFMTEPRNWFSIYCQKDLCRFAFASHCTRWPIRLTYSFFQPIRNKSNPILIGCTHVFPRFETVAHFPRPWQKVRVFVLNSDWFIVLDAFAAIPCCDSLNSFWFYVCMTSSVYKKQLGMFL